MAPRGKAASEAIAALKSAHKAEGKALTKLARVCKPKAMRALTAEQEDIFDNPVAIAALKGRRAPRGRRLKPAPVEFSSEEIFENPAAISALTGKPVKEHKVRKTRAKKAAGAPKTKRAPTAHALKTKALMATGLSFAAASKAASKKD